VTTTGDAPGVPAKFRGRLVEVARHEWSDPGDFDFRQLCDFLRSTGLGRVDSLAGGTDKPGGPVGAAVLLTGDLRPAGAKSRPRQSPAHDLPVACAVVYDDTAAPAVRGSGRAHIGDWLGSWSPGDHAGAVESVRQAIALGDAYQVNLVGHLSAPFSGDPAAVSECLTQIEDTPYAGALAGQGWSVHSASPECLVRVVNGVVSTQPIKGTVAAGADPGGDARARAQLAASEKDRAEHVMIVDLARNDLGRLAVTGGVSVPSLYAVRKLAGVWHAESVVSAQLRPEIGLTELLEAVFPGGSVTGAPKLAALRLIDELEPVGRGPAMGAMGWIGADGTIELGLTIRTLAVAGGRVHLWAGGGVTWSSDPEGEVAEAAAKAAPILRALAPLQR
jgi:para-aminobenzoate synthetase component I